MGLIRADEFRQSAVRIALNSGLTGEVKMFKALVRRI